MLSQEITLAPGTPVIKLFNDYGYNYTQILSNVFARGEPKPIRRMHEHLKTWK